MISRRFQRVAFFLAALGAAGMAATAFAGPSLAASEFEPDEIDAKALSALIATSRVILVDVRLAEEYAVSRIKGAIRTDYEVETDALVRLLGPRLKGAEVVLYCTVGPRSAGLGINTQEALQMAGAKRVRVLKDGLIAWANAGLPLVDAKGPTRFVHPADQDTAKRLTDPKRARFEPRR